MGGRITKKQIKKSNEQEKVARVVRGAVGAWQLPCGSEPGPARGRVWAWAKRV